MRRSALSLTALLAAGLAGPAAALSAGDPAAVRTGKERLADKASDAQRVDDCKVAPERRGPLPRPTACHLRRGGVDSRAGVGVPGGATAATSAATDESRIGRGR